jgi:hypothetical protein
VNRYVVSGDAACAVVEDGAVVLNMRTKRYYSLNETGAAIWRLLEDDVPLPEIVAQLIQRYEVERAHADRAVAALLADLTSEALVSLEPA